MLPVIQPSRASAHPAVLPRALRRPKLRPALLHGVSLSALVVAGGTLMPAMAAPPPVRSLGASISSGMQAAIRAAQMGGGAVAAQQAGLGAQNVAVAAQRMLALSQKLASATYTGAPVPDGVGTGGLLQAPGVAGSSGNSQWVGANTTLGQSTSNGTVDVTVTQTQQVASLNWQNFNVGAHTKLIFNQSQGGSQANTWIAINSVSDPNASPSTILGEISAPGKVFILNPNGILFGSGSMVNVGGLVASTAKIAAAQLTTSTSGQLIFSLYGTSSGTATTNTFTPTFTGAAEGASVVVQPGAVIETPYPGGTSGGGYVMLLGASVVNGGAISTPQGQTVLGAGNDFAFQPGNSSNVATATVIGSQVDARTTASIMGTGALALGAVTNAGVVVADQGDITMAGHAIAQDGVLLATTTVDNRGTEHFLTSNSDTTASIVFGTNSVTEIVPMELYSVNGTLETALRDPTAPEAGILQTALSAQRSTDLTLSAQANLTRGRQGAQLLDSNTLPDYNWESRIEVSTGGTVDMRNGALAVAQGGQVAVMGSSAILLESGSTIDVSGVNTSLAASADSLFIQGIVPYYLRDSAANRTGGLTFQNVYIDERTLVEITSGSYTGNIYTQGGLLEVSGNLGLVGHGINEWSSLGGQVTLQAESTSGGVTTSGSLVQAQGSTINLTGGSVTYDAGLVHESYVVAANGEVFNINTAPGNLVYTGVFNGVQEAHPRWHVTQTFSNPLLTPAEIMQGAYTIGRDAGSLTISTATAVIEGAVYAGVTVGNTQTVLRGPNMTLGAATTTVSNGSTTTTYFDPFPLAQTVAPDAGTLTVGAYESGSILGTLFDSTVVVGLLGGGGNNHAPLMTALPDAVTGTVSIDAGLISGGNFGYISFATSGSITVAGAIAAGEGGTVALNGAAVAVDADIVAHGGDITLSDLFPGNNSLTVASGYGSITLAAGAMLDASGVWANGETDPNALSHTDHIAGGTVNVLSTGGIDLASGSSIDVNSGGLLTAAGKLTAAAGGSVNISADIVPTIATSYDPYGAIALNSRISGYASGAGGTLSITVPQIDFGELVGGLPLHMTTLDPASILVLSDNSLLSTGFGNYVLNGFYGLEVDSGHSIDVTRPVFVLGDHASAVATGAPSSNAYSLILPPLYVGQPAGDRVQQRAGASVTLAASVSPTFYAGGGGVIYIDHGASVTVDPGQSIAAYGYGQVTDYGTLTAHGGTITIGNTRYEGDYNQESGFQNQSNYTDGLSVWIGSDAVVDASGQAVSFVDTRGRRYGQAQAGGTILLGGIGGLSAASLLTTYAQVIVRPGALLDASGADVTVDAGPGLGQNSIAVFATPITLSGAGGTIGARSMEGIAFDGTMEAAGAGPGASGGDLQIRLDQQNVDALYGMPAKAVAPSQILISQYAVPVQTEAGLAPGDATDPTTVGVARISQQQIDDGGFASMSLYAQDGVLFDGNVDLHLSRALYLGGGIVGEYVHVVNTTIPQAYGTVTVTVPYIDFIGYNANEQGDHGPALIATLTDAKLIVDADLIDIQDHVDFGAERTVGQPAATQGTPSGTVVVAEAFGFAEAELYSAGDVRMLGPTSLSSGSAETVLSSADNLTIRSAQLYPVTGATAAIFAGDNPNAPTGGNRFGDGTLTIEGLGGAAPAGPYSVDGTLALVADNIVQDGIVRAPEGIITFGYSGSDPNGGSSTYGVTQDVVLGPRSITSVSLYGQTIPYGGTVDGVNYLYAGSAVQTFEPTVAVNSASFTTQPGSVLDLRGGGVLAGAGFIPGRGGSADVNTTPLLNTSSGTVTANTTDGVYAILPGYSSGYAPLAPGDAGYDTPGIGQQVTIGAGEVAGLAAGTYTLLPAYYDLLPGAYRVELTNAIAQPGYSVYFGNFTTEAAVNVGIANSGIIASAPTMALITSGSGVRQLSQYDEETYNQFEVDAASTFNTPRAFLPQDAKTLDITLYAPASGLVNGTDPLSIASGTVLAAPAAYGSPGAQAVGYGATVSVTSSEPIDVIPTGGSLSTSGTGTVPAFAITDGALAALTAPVAVTYTTTETVAGRPVVETLTDDAGTRLILGGTLTIAPTTPNSVTLIGSTPSVTIMPGADVRAADIMLTSTGNGSIIVSGGATLSTLNEGNAPYGAAQGYFFTTENGSGGYPALDVSNNVILFTAGTSTANGAAIEIDTGALLQGGKQGSINIVAPSGVNVQIDQATLAAADVFVQAANINVGSAADLTDFANVLPGGFQLTDAALATLAAQAQVLSLTAVQEVNILGNVQLNSGSTDLVLYSPAIYGYGISNSAGGVSEGGTISIVAPDFTWGGVAAQLVPTGPSSILPTTISATPGGRLGDLADTAGTATLTGAAALTVDAHTITLGYGPDTPPNDQVELDRLAVGFDTVTLAATQEITANNQSTLDVYQTQAMLGQPGTGGDLVLSAPLITSASGAVLKLTAGGALTANTGGGSAAATGTISTLGGEIDLTAGTIDTSTAFALPAGKLTMTAQDGIDLQAGTDIDLSGRSTHLFDQTAQSNGGTLIMETYAGTNSSITEEQGAVIDVASPGAEAGSISATAQGGTVGLFGTLLGSGATLGGSFSVAANAFGSNGTLSGFDTINAVLDAGGFTAQRNFELGSGDITIDQTIAARRVSIAADAGNIDVVGTIDASGATVGSITLAAGGNLTLESTAVLDAHASSTVVDAYGSEIDAENRAHVTLTSTGGTVTLNPGATINVSYPDAGNPQGQLVINAPRTQGGVVITAVNPTQVGDGVAVSAPGPLNILGARSIDLFAGIIYSPTDANGTIVQDNTEQYAPAGALGLVQIDAANQQFMAAIGANAAALETQLKGLVSYGQAFNLAPGVTIVSSAATGGNLTISGDLDFSGFRYSDPSAFGIGTTSVYGSGEPGQISFRASNDLTINGSVTDGFGKPIESTQGTLLPADTNGWTIVSQQNANGQGVFEPTDTDLLLPSSSYAFVTTKSGESTSSEIVLMGNNTGFASKGSPITYFDTDRPISLNYAIVINQATLNANVVIPFAVTVGVLTAKIGAGGWVATAVITDQNGNVLFNAGDHIPAGYQFAVGDVLGKGTVMPIQVTTGITGNGIATDCYGVVCAGQLVPEGTPLNVFASQQISLAQNTDILPANAFIPSYTQMAFGAVLSGETSQTATDADGIEFRQAQSIDGNQVQGYLYPLAQMLPAGSLSWTMNFVAGANLAAANTASVQAPTSLQQGAFGDTEAGAQQPGSLLLADDHYLAANWRGIDINQFGSNSSSDGYSTAVTAFSVIRTGTGDLSLVAGGNFDQTSLYGIYTAGTQDPLGGGLDAQFNLPRQDLGTGANAGQLFEPGRKDTTTPLESALISATYQAYYPTDGGDVLVAAGGDMTGDVIGPSPSSSNIAPSDAVGNWLWRQGSGVLPQNTAWWINFGTLVDPLDSNESYATNNPFVQMAGFTGIGALGGGNVTVDVGGDAGQLTARDEGGSGGNSSNGPSFYRGEGLVIAVGATGRLADGTLYQTGGGNISLTVGGGLNPLDEAAYNDGASYNGSASPTNEPQAVNGDLIDIRGDINATAGAIGRIDYAFNSGTGNLNDPRATNPFVPNDGVPNGGITVVPGDGTVTLTTLRDLVVGGAGDPGRQVVQGLVADNATDATAGDGVVTGFTLWQDGTNNGSVTAISLFSNGGNATPTTIPNESSSTAISNEFVTDLRSEYPATLLVYTPSGNIIYGQDGSEPGNTSNNSVLYSLETMPSASGEVKFLASGSIYANGYAIDMSGAATAGLPGPAAPASEAVGSSGNEIGTNVLASPQTAQNSGVPGPLQLFSLEADTPTTNLHQNDPDPALFYAVSGDIVNFRTGETLTFETGQSTDQVVATWYIAAKPVWIIAGNDIVSTGNRPSGYPGANVFSVQENQIDVPPNGGQALYEYSSGNLILNNNPGDISIISAGRDILSAFAYIAGPGVLDVTAGRNLYQAGYAVSTNGQTYQELYFGSLKSLGDNIIPGSPLSLSGGASIDITVGAGSSGQDTSAFANLYFSPADQYNFQGTFPDPSLKGGKFVYDGDVLFDYGTQISYGDIGGIIASVTGSTFFVKPAGGNSGGAGVAVPSGIAVLLKAIEASDAKLPAGQNFSGLQILLWQYAGYRGTAADAFDFYSRLPAETQAVIVRMAFFDELQASGVDHSDPSSSFYGSYVRGREAIDTLFPSLAGTQSVAGVPAGYNGTITMYSGPLTLSDSGQSTAFTTDGGVATLYGGDVQVLDPGGAMEFGIPGGPAPGNSSGVITFGSGDIEMYALDSVLLGKSRIFATGGGNIVIWSSQGDINAGIGAKTTVSYNPPVLVNDAEGDVTQAPPASTSGAGIATLQPLPSVPAGNVSLIAPGGTIDAGEAGIRVSGNLVLAAARVTGTANISVKGSTAGAPTVSVASIGAVEAAASSAGASTSAAQAAGQRNTETREVASIVEVDVLSIGGTYDEERKRRKRAQQ